jgi:5-methylthioadenosine/S-adenosylhomocysteine deaminase
MKKANTIFTNALVLTMNPSLTHFHDGSVVVEGDSISAVGFTSEILKSYTSDEIIDCQGNILMPGMVNIHTHLPMNMLRGLADDLRLDVWLQGYVWPVEHEFVTPEFVRLGTQIACTELIRSGVTCFADMYFFEDTVAEVAAEFGLRAVCSQTVLKYPTPDAHSYEEAIEATRRMVNKWKNHPLIVPSIAPHAAYTCPPEILHACTEVALEYDVPLHIHIAETADEVENMRKETGMPVVPYLKKQGLFEAKVFAAHCVHIDEGEMRTLKHSNVGVSHNPSSNLKLASGIAPVRKMLENGLNVGIGTDGTASNNDLDFFEEIRLASFLAKGSSGDPTAIPAQKTLEMATRIGAQAIHLGDITGSIEVGKRADMILINIHTIHNSPRFNHSEFAPYAQIVYAGKSTDVTDVMVNGKWLMRNHQLASINENEMMIKSQEYAREIDQFLIKREKSVLSKLIAIGGTSQEESYEVQAKVVINNSDEIIRKLSDPQIRIIRQRHYHEFDTYFSFKVEPDLLRYREDHFLEDNGEIYNVRSRLTLIQPSREDHYPEDIVLSKSRYIAPANQGLRFYKEYFRPSKETEIEKDRIRFLVDYKEEEFFINIDRIEKPDLGIFLEVKARTWSQKDAQEKSEKIVGLLKLLGLSTRKIITRDYIELVTSKNNK